MNGDEKKVKKGQDTSEVIDLTEDDDMEFQVTLLNENNLLLYF